ncbi:MAG: polysaccharide biosynthesis tyrosine autokinase [Deltaproteobacteria bacterium]|nr:polysaccharide biosynthesis tyrosine autokinase [Deltaproteobacteria bacterium]
MSEVREKALVSAEGEGRQLASVSKWDHRQHWGAAPSEPSLLEYAALMFKNRRTILVAVVLSLAIGALYGALAPRKYTATAAIEVGGYVPTLSDAGVEQALRQQSQDQKYLQTQVAKLGRLSLADYVLTKNGLSARIADYNREQRSFLQRIWQGLRALISTKPTTSAAVGGHYQHEDAFLRSFLNLVKIEPVFATSLIELVATTVDPVLSRDIANAYVEGFIEHSRGEWHGQVRESVSFLQSQADDLGRKVAEAERDLATYAEQHELLSLSNHESMVVREISTLTQKLSESTGRRIRSESMFRNVEHGNVADSTILDDESIRTMRVELKRAEAEYQDLEQKVMPAYPPMQQLKAKVAALKANVAEQRRQALAALKTRYQSDLAAESALREQLEKLKQTAFKNSRELVRYNILKREYESLKDLHQSLLKQLKETQVSSAGRSSNIMVAEYAALPSEPSSPRIGLIMAIAACAGALAGMAWVLVRDLVYGTVDEPEDVYSGLGVGLLGTIPRFGEVKPPHLLLRWKEEARRLLPGPKTEQIDKSAPELSEESEFITVSIPGAAASEAFRTLRASILLSSADDPQRIILVASALQGDGKTTVASNLAVTLAQAGHRTVVVDADLRRRRLQQRFHGRATCRGLTDYLTGQATLEEVSIHSLVRGLVVIAAGSAAPNPAELVGSSKMRELLLRLRDTYDYVLLDSPPVLTVSDAIMLSAMVDGVVFVVRSTDTERKSALRGLELLRQVQARVLGVVLNAFNSESSPGDYGYAYGYADGYGAQNGAKRPVVEVSGKSACG